MLSGVNPAPTVTAMRDRRKWLVDTLLRESPSEFRPFFKEINFKKNILFEIN
jgi:hypothetical protein